MRAAPDGVTLNPFRAPLRQPLVAGGAVGFPWLSNGFLAGWNVEASAEDHAATERRVAAARAALRKRKEGT